MQISNLVRTVTRNKNQLHSNIQNSEKKRSGCNGVQIVFCRIWRQECVGRPCHCISWHSHSQSDLNIFAICTMDAFIWVTERVIWGLTSLWHFFGLIATRTRFMKFEGLIYEQNRVCWCAFIWNGSGESSPKHANQQLFRHIRQYKGY